VGINTVSPNGKLQVKAATNQNFYIGPASSIANSVVVGTLNDAANASVPIEFRYGTTAAFINNGTETMRIESGNVAIGSTTSAVKLYVNANTTGGTSNSIRLFDDGAASTSASNNSYGYGFNAGTGELSSTAGNGGFHSWYTSNAERARIDPSGNLLVGQTSGGLLNSNSFSLQPASAGSAYASHANGSASGNGYWFFGYNGGSIGSITQNGTTGVLYNLTSDYRLKNNQQPLTGAKEFVMALQPKKWQWWDGSGEGVGFIAHEFMEVAKYSGQGIKDAVETVEIKDEQGNVTGTEQRPIHQSIQPSSSEVMANLVSFIQEQQAIITVLTNRITALEAVS
jgi:hypothetical protein